MLQTAAFARVPAWTFLPHFPGGLKSECCWFQSEWLVYGREPNGVKAEPGKHRTRSCRSQKNERQEKAGLLNQ
jgi:hypothetical protein